MICDRSGEGNLLIPKDSEKKTARFGETNVLEGPKLNDFLGQKYPMKSIQNELRPTAFGASCSEGLKMIRANLNISKP